MLVEGVILGKRKAEREESSSMSLTSKRARREALNTGCGLAKKTRLLAEVRNEPLRLHAMTQFLLLRPMFAMNNQAVSFISATNTEVPSALSPKPCRRSLRIASQHRKLR